MVVHCRCSPLSTVESQRWRAASFVVAVLVMFWNGKNRVSSSSVSAQWRAMLTVYHTVSCEDTEDADASAEPLVHSSIPLKGGRRRRGRKDKNNSNVRPSLSTSSYRVTPFSLSFPIPSLLRLSVLFSTASSGMSSLMRALPKETFRLTETTHVLHHLVTLSLGLG